MRVRNLAFFCLLLCSAFLAACGASSPNQGSSATSNGACTDAYAYAPGAYIINIVSGDAVILDPLSNDFFLFCTPQAARTHLEQKIADRQLPAGDWKVYHVYGNWNELATEVGPNVFLLNRPAPIVDWVN